MSVFFGTDGIRGEIGKNLNHEIAYNCGNALAKLYPHSRILIGKDTRLSGDYILVSFASGVISAGGDITNIGICPTPAIAHLTHALGFDFGVSITASHNPPSDNGIKIFDNNYKKISTGLEERLERNFFNSTTLPNEELGHIYFKPELKNTYIEKAKSFCKKNKKLKMVIDCANGATSIYAEKIFSKLYDKVTIIHSSTNGVDINKDCGATSVASLRKTVFESKADIGFAFDGDGDRIIAIDQSGEIIDGDKILYILAKYYKERKTLRPLEVVGTEQSNMALESALKKEGIKFHRTKVGDKYVLEKMEKNNLQLGAEQSGHIIQKDIVPTGDGIVTAITLCNILRDTGKTLGELVDFTPYPQYTQNIPTANKDKIIFNDALKETIEKINESFKKEGRVIVRPSGTEPVIRIMVESKDNERNKEIANKLSKLITQIDKGESICVE